MPSLVSATVAAGQDITIGQMNNVVTDIQMLALLKRARRQQAANVTAAASTNSTVVTSLMAGKTSGGSASQTGVVTSSPDNKVILKNDAGANAGKEPLDGSGNVIYGRLTFASNVWTLRYYTAPSGVETAYTWPASPASTVLRWWYLESFNLMDEPYNAGDMVSDSVTATIPDATSTVSGKVLLGAAGGAFALSPGTTQQVALQSSSIGVQIKMAASHTADPFQILDSANAVKAAVTKDGDISGRKGTFTGALAGTDLTVGAGNTAGVLLGTATVGTRLYSTQTGSVDNLDMASVLTGLGSGTGITISGSGHSRSIATSAVLSVGVAANSAITANTNAQAVTLDVNTATNAQKGVASFSTGLAINAGVVTNDGVLTVTTAAPFSTLTNAKGNITIGFANQAINTIFAGPASGSSGAPAFRALVAADLPTVTIAKGGTGAATKADAFNALQPMTELGALIYGGTSGAASVLAPNKTTTRKFLRSVGPSAGTGAAPDWDVITAADLPDANGTTKGAVSTSAGSGVSIVNGAISNSDKGSDQQIFKEIQLSTDAAQKVAVNANSTVLKLAQGTAISLGFNNTTKTITIGLSETYIKKSGETGIGNLGMGELTATKVTSSGPVDGTTASFTGNMGTSGGNMSVPANKAFLVGTTPVWHADNDGKGSGLDADKVRGVQAQRSNTVVVAASDTSTAGKDLADYVCDGTADQTEINAAIGAASNVGGRVILLEGSFILSGSVNLNDNITLEGQGAGTVLRIANNLNAAINAIANTDIAMGNTNLRIANLRVDGNKASNTSGTQVGILLSNSVNCFIENVWVDSTRNEGIKVDGGSGNLVRDARVSNTGSDGLYLGGERNTIQHCHSNDCFVGIRMTGNYNILQNNVVFKSKQHGIWVYSSFDGRVEGNYVWGSGQAAANTYNCIELSNSSTRNYVCNNTVRSDVNCKAYYGIRAQEDAPTNIVVMNDGLGGNWALKQFQLSGNYMTATSGNFPSNS